MHRIFFVFFTLSLFGCDSGGDAVDACGDGVVDVGEECDGGDLGGASCTGLGYYGGAISCDSNCMLVRTGCEAAGRCGDGVIQSGNGEACDGLALGTATCTTEAGTYTGELSCTDTCQIDTSGCTGVCGDNVLDEAFEECDGTDTPTCFELGLGFFGSATCDETCGLDTSDCRFTEIWGTYDDDRGAAMTQDASGNIYTTGYINTQDMFIRKYSSRGTIEWNLTLGTPGDDRGMGIAMAPDGNIVITGRTEGDLGGQTNNGGYDVFITKMTTDGSTLFTTLWGTGNQEEGLAVAVAPAGDIYAAGYWEGGTLFVLHFDADGTFLSSDESIIGNCTTDRYYVDMATDSQGNVYTAISSKYLQGATQTYANTMLFKHDSTLSSRDVLIFEDTVNNQGPGLYIDADDNIFVAGQTSGVLGSENFGSADLFIAKIAPDTFEVDFFSQFGTDTGDLAMDITGDAQGNLYLTGATYGPLGGQPCVWGFDIFVSKFSSTGTHLWTRIFASPMNEATQYNIGDEIGHAIEVLPTGDVIVLGRGNGGLGQIAYTDNSLGQNIVMVHVPPQD